MLPRKRASGLPHDDATPNKRRAIDPKRNSHSLDTVAVKIKAIGLAGKEELKEEQHIWPPWWNTLPFEPYNDYCDFHTWAKENLNGLVGAKYTDCVPFFLNKQPDLVERAKDKIKVWLKSHKYRSTSMYKTKNLEWFKGDSRINSSKIKSMTLQVERIKQQANDEIEKVSDVTGLCEYELKKMEKFN